jgi:hypothetical protein
MAQLSGAARENLRDLVFLAGLVLLERNQTLGSPLAAAVTHHAPAVRSPSLHK